MYRPLTIGTHLRLAGDEIPYLVKDATGVDLIDYLVRQTLGERILPLVRIALTGSPRPPQAIWFGVAPVEATLQRIDGLAEAGRTEGITLVQDVPDGDQLTELKDSGSRPLWARAEGPDPETAITLAHEAVARCRLVLAVRPTSSKHLKEYL